MRPYSASRIFEFLVVAVIEEIVKDSFNSSVYLPDNQYDLSFLLILLHLNHFLNPHLTENMRSFFSENMSHFPL